MKKILDIEKILDNKKIICIALSMILLASIGLNVYFIFFQTKKYPQGVDQIHTTDTDYENFVSEEAYESSPLEENDVAQSYTGVWGYTGYLDECVEWTEYEEFVGCDYDEDGKIDRVYRNNIEETDTCVYRIEFGNNAVLEMGKVVWNTGFPHIQTADLQGDGAKEIIFTLTYDTSTGPMSFGDFAVFERIPEDEYSFKKLAMPEPFKESDLGYSQKLPICYEKEKEQSLRVRCEEIGADFVMPIDSYRWDDLQYSAYPGSIIENPVWRVEVVESEGEKDKLKCGIALFDKWSTDELLVTIGYDEKLVVEDVEILVSQLTIQEY